MRESKTSIVGLRGLVVLLAFITACATNGVNPPPVVDDLPPSDDPTGISPSANKNTRGVPRLDENGQPMGISSAESAPERTSARPNRILTLEQLPENTRANLGLGDVVGTEAFGNMNHPYTTKRASAKNGVPVGEFPWRATGKLIMKFGSSTFVCTASVIEKGLLVTAAHCVHNYGEKQSGFADAVTFEPARHGSDRPFGTWTATEWWIPSVYFDGTDQCTTSGVVCENDLAIVVLNKKNGQSIKDVTGKYGYPKSDPDDDFGYTGFLGEQSGQITQLGYPSANFSGDKMIRTDSLGYWDTPNNVVIGSAQTGGSSGGPWIMNFGIDTSSSAPQGSDDKSNQVVATTSWGFTSGTAKMQGASRFSRNAAYTTKSNIESLVESVCNANPDAC